MPVSFASDRHDRLAERGSHDSGVTPVHRSLGLPYWLPWVVAGVALLRQSAFPHGVDTAWLIVVGRRMLEGSALYSPDIVEINLPLIMELKAFIVWVARLVKLDALEAWQVFVGMQIVGTLWLLWHILSGTGLRHHRTSVMAVAAVALAAAPGADFGQREHLIALWLVPYVAGAACRAMGAPNTTTLRLITGTAAGLALSVKPHFAMVVAAVEAVVWWEGRPRRWVSFLEPLTVAAVAAADLVFIWWRHQGFFSLALPLAIQHYGAYRYGGSTVRLVHLVYPAASMVLAWATRRLLGVGAVTRVYVIAGLGSLFVFAIQDKGFAYQYLPAKIMFLIAGGTAAIEAVRVGLAHTAGPGRRALWAMVRLAIIVGLVGTAVGLQQRALIKALGEESWRRTQEMESVLERLGAGRGTNTHLLSLAVTPSLAFPLAERVQAVWSSRFSCLWMMPGVIDDEARSAGSARARTLGREYVSRAVVEDLERWQPRVVLVQRGHEVSALDELLLDDQFRATWARYRLVESVDGVDVFTVDGPHPTCDGAAAAANDRDGPGPRVWR